MDLFQKISILGPSAQYDTCGPKDFGKTTDIPGVYHAKIANGAICRLFKVLQTNVCQNNCYYCAFRKDRATLRTAATSDEMAQAFDSAYRRRLVDGLFLSSGIANNADSTMTKMLDTATLLRTRYFYKGYIHLKLMPGASLGCIQEAIKLANRVSLNIEAPTETALTALSPNKRLGAHLYDTLNIVKKSLLLLKNEGKRIPSLTTQFVVGATQETDLDIIKATFTLYRSYNLTRVFYSAFRPVPNTPLAEHPPESRTREHRLYQADFLMRQYRFLPATIPLTSNGFLFKTTDPKMAWAQQNPQQFPININSANYWELVKIPGIGPIAAKKICCIRSREKIKNLEQLKGHHIQLNKATAFICF